MNIVLIGYRCSGKSTVGSLIASRMGRNFLDTDDLIAEDATCPIDQIIQRKGWHYFRGIEKQIIERVTRKTHAVIATGGGVVVDEENIKRLKSTGWVVWLKGKPEVLRERMAKEQGSGRVRPSLTGADPLEEIREVLSVRKPFYERAGDLVVDTSTLSIRDAADLIIENLPK